MKQTEILTRANSCERLGTTRSHELHESKFPFVSRIEFIRSKLSNFSAHVYGVIVFHPARATSCPPGPGGARPLRIIGQHVADPVCVGLHARVQSGDLSAADDATQTDHPDQLVLLVHLLPGGGGRGTL